MLLDSNGKDSEGQDKKGSFVIVPVRKKSFGILIQNCKFDYLKKILYSV